jgi:hypothetical protein
MALLPSQCRSLELIHHTLLSFLVSIYRVLYTQLVLEFGEIWREIEMIWGEYLEPFNYDPLVLDTNEKYIQDRKNRL